MKPFRLAILQLDLFPMSPFARHVQNLANEIGPEFHLDVLVVNEAGMDQVPERVSVTLLGADAGHLSKLLPAHYRAIPGLIRYLRTADVDAVLARGLPFGVPLVIAQRLSNTSVPMLMSLHVALDHEKSNRSHRLGFAYGPMYRFVEKRLLAVLPVSEGVRDSYLRLARSPSLMHVVANPVFSQSLLSMAEERIEHPWFSEERAFTTVLTVGRLAPEKEQYLQIEAIRILREKQLDVRLVIIGDGPLRGKLEEIIAGSGLEDAVQLLGRKDNPFPYMRRCDVFCLSSKYEGLPGVLIQAMALGCRLVSTDCVAGPAEILNQGELGELVPVGDAQALADGVERSLERCIDYSELQQKSMSYSVWNFIRKVRDISGVARVRAGHS